MDHNKSEGQFRLTCIDKNGKLKWDTGWVHNLGTSARLPVIAGLYLNTGSQTAFSYLELGTSSTAVSAAHTALQAAITDSGLERAAATASRTTTTTTNDTSLLTKTWTATGSKTIEEIGYFNASSGPTMGGRALTGTRSVVSGDSITANYKIIHT